MRIIAILALTLCCSVAAYAQQAKPASDEPKQESNIEKFLAKSGTLTERVYTPLGTVSGKYHAIKIDHLLITDVLSKTRISGVRFEKPAGTGERAASAFLDADEIDALLSSVVYFKTLVGTKREAYTEVEYRSRSGFSGGCYFSKDAWSFFLRISRFDSTSLVPLTLDGLDELTATLQKAKVKLK